MEIGLLVGAALIVGAACPTIAWVQRRRGRASCCSPSRERETAGVETGAADEDLVSLRAEQERIAQRIEAIERRPMADAAGRH